MAILKPIIDRRKMLMEHGSVKAFANANNINERALFTLLNDRKKVNYFQTNSLTKQTYDKLKELGYIISV